MKQLEIRWKKNKRWLSEKEKKVQRIWEEIQKLYIDYRITQDQLINSVDDSLIFDDLKNNLVWNEDLENKLFELQKNYELVLKPKYNTVILAQEDTNIIEEQLEDNQKQVSFLFSYKKLLEELWFRYKVEMNKRKRELEDEDKKYHITVLHTINNLPTIIKEKGIRKFDSKYYNFYEWLIKNNKEFDNQTPLEFIKESKNTENKEIILQLIQDLSSAK